VYVAASAMSWSLVQRSTVSFVCVCVCVLLIVSDLEALTMTRPRSGFCCRTTVKENKRSFTNIQNVSSLLRSLISSRNSIPLQAWTGPKGFRRLRLPDFKTVGTWKWYGCQPYAPATFTSRNYSWYSFLLEAESTSGS